MHKLRDTIRTLKDLHPNDNGTMAEVIGWLEDYERIIKALPRTADGVTVVPGDDAGVRKAIRRCACGISHDARHDP
jgi:hypothetical protein